MEQSPRLSLSYVAPSQAQKHVTVNETFRRLDALVQLTVRSRTVSVEPAAPSEGDGYILPANPTGAAWSQMAPHNLAFYQDSAWISAASVEGLQAYVADESAVVVFDGAAWGVSGEKAEQFGVNTAADATNRLSVKSDAILFSHDDVTPGSGDAQVKVNKAGAGDTASHLFQTGFSGRAEFGLTGDDDFHVKVSPDGAAWNDAILIDKDDGGTLIQESLKVHLDADTTPFTNLFQVSGDFWINVAFTSHHEGNGHPIIAGMKSRGTAAAPAIIQDDDTIFQFVARVYDGVQYRNAGSIAFQVDGAPGAGDTPGRIIFRTVPDGGASDIERMRVTRDGDVGIGITAPSARLDVDGAVRVKSYTVAGAPSASGQGAGAIIFISDETGGAVIAFSDGTNWRRVTDRAVIS